MSPSHFARRGSWLVILSAAALLAPEIALAGRQITYQGRLENPPGTPVTSEVTILVSLWDQEIVGSGTMIWGPEQHTVTPDGQGRFVVLIGSTTPTLSNDLDVLNLTDDVPVYLQVTITPGTTLSPRQRLVPAFHASSADSVPNASITEAKLADGSVTTSKISANAVTGNEIAPSAVGTDEIADDSITATDIGIPLVTAFGSTDRGLVYARINCNTGNCTELESWGGPGSWIGGFDVGGTANLCLVDGALAPSGVEPSPRCFVSGGETANTPHSAEFNPGWVQCAGITGQDWAVQVGGSTGASTSNLGTFDILCLIVSP